MRVYKPFDSLFCSIETLYSLTGIGGFYQSVSGLIATLQLFNVITIMSLFTYITNFKIRFLYFIIAYVILIAFNWIYFKDSRIEILLIEHKNRTRRMKSMIGIISILYIISSFVFMIISYND